MKKENKAYVRVYRYAYQRRIGIVDLDQKTMERLFPIPDIKGVGGPFYFEITAKPIKEKDVPFTMELISSKITYKIK